MLLIDTHANYCSTSFSTVAETTVTLPTVTVTETVEPGGIKARTVIIGNDATSVGGTTYPAYASACSSYAAYVSACSCVGVTAVTTTLPTPSTTVVVTTGTDTVIPTTTATVTNIVINGGFETGDWAPWIPTTGSASSRAYGDVAAGGKDSTWAVLSNNLYDNRLFEFYQELKGTRGTTYACSYDWKFTAYYEEVYKDGTTYVPYIHGYFNNKLYTVDIPYVVNEWQTTEFEFKSNGKDKWWFDCASPQPRCGEGKGSNYLSIDNVVCIAKQSQK